MKTTLERLKAELSSTAALVPEYPEDRFEGRGIVICAGGARLFTCAWIAIALLRRHLGCTLPIEVWHLGSVEMSLPMRGLLEELNAQAVDALEMAKRHTFLRRGGWELKPYALMHSRFREVMFLDADNLPVRDPSFLLDRPEFNETGSLFWPDVVRISRDNRIWEISGLDYRDMPSFETGQIVIDKSKCWPALSLTHWMNQRSDLFYQFLYGDKDTFLISWLLLSQPFFQIPHLPKQLPHTLCQRDPDGKLLFQHRSGAKWILDGDNPVIDGFRLEDECRLLIGELSKAWDGRIFDLPTRSSEALSHERALMTTSEFDVKFVTSHERRIKLLPDHRIHPSERNQRYWYVGDGPDGLTLHIEGDGVKCCALRPCEGGNWRGQLLQSPGNPVELVPVLPTKEFQVEGLIQQDQGFMALIDRMLNLGLSLPWDCTLARDIIGALRILAMLDSNVLKQLEAERVSSTPGSPKARLVGEALTEIVSPIPTGEVEVSLGNGWRGSSANIQRGYDRLR